MNANKLPKHTAMPTETYSYHAEITVQKYVYGQPFPGLVAQFDGLPALPKEAQTFIKGAMGLWSRNANPLGIKAGIVLTDAGLYEIVFDGQYMQVQPQGGPWQEGTCVGRVPENFTPVKAS